MLKTLEQCKWSEIEVGEVFAIFGCWVIAYKINDEKALMLASDQEWFDVNNYPGEIAIISTDRVKLTSSVWGTCFSYGDNILGQNRDENLYKLPEFIQSLWMTK